MKANAQTIYMPLRFAIDDFGISIELAQDIITEVMNSVDVAIDLIEEEKFTPVQLAVLTIKNYVQTQLANNNGTHTYQGIHP